MEPKPERSRVSLQNLVTVGILVISRAGISAASSSSSSASSSSSLASLSSSPSVLVPCPAESSIPLVVTDTASARALAETVNCAGGFFRVEWEGEVVVDRGISISHGTCLNVTGAGFDAAMTGVGGDRFFTVVDASLSVSNMHFIGGGNSSVNGGAIYANESSMSFENTSFNGNVGLYGGAIYAWNSGISFKQAEFVGNVGTYDGGALYMLHSTVSWDRTTSLSHNIARLSHGGSIYAEESVLTWEGVTSFTHNIANIYGGAVHMSWGCNATWRAEVSFTNNTVGESGGAVNIDRAFSVVWEAEASFSNNTAALGGAIFVHGTNCSWRADTTFFNNSASGYLIGNGGAVNMKSGNLIWRANSTFSNNKAALRGGALSSHGGIFGLNEAFFLDNSAGSYGGAVSLESRPIEDNVIDHSIFVVEYATEFVGNTCEGSGGGLAMSGEVYVDFGSNSVSFSENSAGVAGGGVYIAGVPTGPEFIGVTFISNTAQFGGGMHATSSGTPYTTDNANPEGQRTSFHRCDFVNNTATSAGGAVDCTSGQEIFVDSNFKGNTAGVGGALRLASSQSSFLNCTFVDNSSNMDEGPAVSKFAGNILSLNSSSFFDNTFECMEGTYLETISDNDENTTFNVACDECDTKCIDCQYDFKVPSCTEQPAHSSSAGGGTTLETLSIDEGYWRAATTSMAVFACYNADACNGGTTGEDDSCADGYEGPYCAVCSDGYTSTQEYVCNKCSNGSGRVVVAIVIGVLGMIALVVFLSYMMSAEGGGAVKGIAASIASHIPLQSIKIIIVAWQILTQFSEVANVTYPSVYQTFLDGIKVLNFDLSWVLSAGCIVDIDFHKRLLTSTLAPFVGMAMLGVTNAIATCRNRGSESALRNVRHKHLSMVLLLTFVVYSSVSSTLFQTFGFDEVDDGVVYLRADYRIDYNSSRHRSFKVYAGLMVVVYTVGIPVFYAILLYKNRELLVNGANRESDPRIKSTTDLWRPYKPDRFFYELVECARRILLAGAVVFIYPNTAAQVAATIMIAVFFIFVSEALAPFASKWDTWVSRMGHGIVFMSMYVALLLKVDVSSERASSREFFDIILVSVHACMICVVVVEAVATACSVFLSEKEDANPRTRPFKPEGVVSEEEACHFRADDGPKG